MSNFPIQTPPVTIIEENIVFPKSMGNLYDESLRMLNIEKYHKIYNLYGDQKYCIIDDGFDQHVNLKETEVKAYGYKNTNSAVGHGNSVQSVIDGQGEPFTGLLPNALPTQKKALGSQGGTFRDINNAFRTAIDEGYKYINFSLGAPSHVFDSEFYAMVKECEEKNIKVAAAAGNENTENKDVPIAFPGNIEYIFTALSIDLEKRHSGFSNTAIKKVRRVYAFPGDRVYLAGLNNSYNKGSGTSFSSPGLLGVIMMIDQAFHREFKRYTTNQEMEDILNEYAEDLGKAGFDGLFGNGLVSLRCVEDRFKTWIDKFGIDMRNDPEWDNTIEEDENHIKKKSWFKRLIDKIKSWFR